MRFLMSGEIIGNDLMEIMAKAIDWVEKLSDKVCSTGEGLTERQQELARSVGVTHPEKIRISFYKDPPQPDDPVLQQAVEQFGFLGPGMIGLTVGHGICIKEGCLTDRLLRHECRHVYQYEKFGSIAAFLSCYLRQIIEYGYDTAPLEEDARRYEV